MNISYKWLKEYVDFDLTPQEVCDALTSEGLEVDALEESTPKFTIQKFSYLTKS